MAATGLATRGMTRQARKRYSGSTWQRRRPVHATGYASSSARRHWSANTSATDSTAGNRAWPNMCPHAKKPLCGLEKPYQVCLHPRTRIVKCTDERRCPLLASGDKDGQSATDGLRGRLRASTGASVEQMDLFRDGTGDAGDSAEDGSCDWDDNPPCDWFA